MQLRGPHSGSDERRSERRTIILSRSSERPDWRSRSCAAWPAVSHGLGARRDGRSGKRHCSSLWLPHLKLESAPKRTAFAANSRMTGNWTLRLARVGILSRLRRSAMREADIVALGKFTRFPSPHGSLVVSPHYAAL